jgi:hypothetical protein
MEWEEKKEVKEEKIYNLFRCGYLDVREWLKETDIVLIPLGSTEQHGRHCPVCTDSIATELPCQHSRGLFTPAPACPRYRVRDGHS